MKKTVTFDFRCESDLPRRLKKLAKKKRVATSAMVRDWLWKKLEDEELVAPPVMPIVDRSQPVGGHVVPGILSPTA